MKLIIHSWQRGLLIVALLAGTAHLRAQNSEDAPAAETAEKADATETEQEAQPAKTDSDEIKPRTKEINNEISRAISDEISDAIVARDSDSSDRERSVRQFRNQWRHSDPYVGILNDITVDQGEVAEMVVAILADYVIEGRSEREAVTVLGKGTISGPVGGDAVTVLGSVEINAPVNGNVVVVCSDAYINAPIDGDVVLVLSNVEFGPDARVNGETMIIGPPPKTDPAVVFNGPKRKVHLPDLSWLGDYIRSGPLLGRPIAPGIAWVWYVVLFFFLCRLILLLLFPRPINAGVKVMQQSSLRTFLIGVIAYILYLPALALLGATVVGGIAIPFVALGWEVATLLGKIAVLVLLGNHLGRQLKIVSMETPLGGFVVGTALLTLVYMVPVLGMLVHFLIKPLALGSMLVAAIDAFQRERRPPTIPSAGGPTRAPEPASTAPFPAPAGESSQTNPATDVPPVIGAARRTQPSPDELATFQRVGFWPRFGASLLDFVLVMTTVAVLSHRPELFPFVWIGYHIAMWSWRGTTLGGIVFSLRIVRLDGRRFDITTAIVRFIGGALSLVIAGLGFFWASWNPEKQSWHDMIAGTIVVKTPRATPLV
jgi:uncharacterized RDD family membrane protein YckC